MQGSSEVAIDQVVGDLFGERTDLLPGAVAPGHQVDDCLALEGVRGKGGWPRHAMRETRSAYGVEAGDHVQIAAVVHIIGVCQLDPVDDVDIEPPRRSRMR